MANNVTAGPNARMATIDLLLSEAGISGEDIIVIYQAEGKYLSWKPDRQINGLKSLTAGNGYIIYARRDADLSDIFNTKDTMAFTVDNFADMEARIVLEKPDIWYTYNIKSDEANPDEYGNMNKPAVYTSYNGYKQKVMQRKEVEG